MLCLIYRLVNNLKIEKRKNVFFAYKSLVQNIQNKDLFDQQILIRLSYYEEQHTNHYARAAFTIKLCRDN